MSQHYLNAIAHIDIIIKKKKKEVNIYVSMQMVNIHMSIINMILIQENV